jgi:ParB-like chromosome segregation protein Spo0J
MPPLSPRERQEDPAHVRLLAETDSSADPLLVHRTTMRVIDGVHRLRAAAMRGRTEITVQFFEGNEADAFVLSVQLNIRHGLPLTLDERKAATQRIIGSHPHWSDRAIAERTGLSAKTVGKVRRRASGDVPHPTSRLGRDGRARPNSSAEGRRNAAAVLAANPEISLRELSRKTGLSVGTVRDVRERLDRGQDPIPKRLRGAKSDAEKGGTVVVTGPQAMTVPARTEARAPRAEAGVAVIETASVVRKLARDPSLRATESGRALLRMLLATEMDRAQWDEIAEAIPAHCVPLVRAVVLKRCEDWRKLASVVPSQSENRS